MPVHGSATISGAPAAGVSSPAGFDPTTAWRRSPRVGLRPEPFGALAYHFDTRRLVFLKSPALVQLVDSLGDHPSAAVAIDSVADTTAQHHAYVRALGSLAESGIIERATETVS